MSPPQAFAFGGKPFDKLLKFNPSKLYYLMIVINRSLIVKILFIYQHEMTLKFNFEQQLLLTFQKPITLKLMISANYFSHRRSQQQKLHKFIKKKNQKS